jgi:hypothetical protein
VTCLGEVAACSEQFWTCKDILIKTGSELRSSVSQGDEEHAIRDQVLVTKGNPRGLAALKSHIASSAVPHVGRKVGDLSARVARYLA